MRCEKIQPQLGCFLDNELASDMRAEIQIHLQTCEACTLELQSLQDLASGLSDSRISTVPANLWASIARRLDAESHPVASPRQSRYGLFRNRPWALAASIAFVVGLGLIGPTLMEPRAEGATVNFAVLLDALDLDGQKAFRKFLVLYDARKGSPLAARRYAPSLDFATPATLPGGFHLKNVYLLRFGNQPGVAAAYEHGGDFLATIFHPPVRREDFGTHQDYDCVIGKHHGHKIEVGEWKLVHLTDATTCHCVLSRLDEKSSLPAVMAAVARRVSNSDPAEHRD